MPVKIRLQRHGKKGKPFYWIVAADSRAKRDGKFLEKLGTYNPLTQPADIRINIDAAVKWLMNGAIPTETARAILKYEGVLYKKHLLVGVRKGAFDMEEAERRFQKWMENHEKKVAALKAKYEAEKAAKQQAVFEREKAYSDAREAQQTEAAAGEEPQEEAQINEESGTQNENPPAEETGQDEEKTAEE
jgi:small subunit ribosomal protein S16